MMKKIICLLTICLLCFFSIACNDLDLNENVKTEFKIHEQANIDHYRIILSKQETFTTYQNTPSSNGQYLLLTFNIQNNSNSTATIQEDSFYLEVDGHTYNPIDFQQVTIASNEDEQITIIYDVPDNDHFSLLFYSGVVSNNIAFDIDLNTK